jgi:N-acetylglutamate synthase-like GNAT family acetyltransferase
LRIKQKEGTFPVKFNDTWYISELGVRIAYRRRGIGTQLIGHCLTRILESQCHYFVLRTAVNNFDSLRIFKKIGAVELPGVQNVTSSKQVKVHKSQSTERIYLYGCCQEGVKNIAKIQQIYSI